MVINKSIYKLLNLQKTHSLNIECVFYLFHIHNRPQVLVAFIYQKHSTWRTKNPQVNE